MLSAARVQSTYFSVRQADEGERDQEPDGKMPPKMIWWGLVAMPVTFGAIVLVAGWLFALLAIVVVLAVLGLVLAFGG
jgi:hypothetical protein